MRYFSKSDKPSKSYFSKSGVPQMSYFTKTYTKSHSSRQAKHHDPMHSQGKHYSPLEKA